MKILVFSDTHGLSSQIQSAIKNTENIDAIFFLGDGENDALEIAEKFPNITFLGVKGNCDQGNAFPLDNIVQLENYTFFLTHGHKYNVKQNLSALHVTAKQVKCDVALFGHTHISFHENIEGIDFFNPGAVSFPKGSTFSSYGIIETNQNKLSFNTIPLKNQSLLYSLFSCSKTK